MAEKDTPKSRCVLQVLPNLISGGVERGTVDVGAALVQAGWRAVVASEGGAMVRELERAGAAAAIAALMLLLIIPGQLGIHPVATGTAMVAAIIPASIGLSVPTFAWTIICGWLLSNMLSPFSALNLTLSGLSGRPSWEVGWGLSWRFGLICFIAYSLMVSVIGPML